MANADRIFSISEHTGRDVMSCLNVAQSKVTAIGAGVAAFFTPLPMNDQKIWCKYFMDELGLNEPFVLTVSGQDWRKNIGGLMAGYAAGTRLNSAKHSLVIVGVFDDESKKRYLEDARTLGIDGRVVFVGTVPREQLRALYSLCDLFVFSSIYEGFGLPVVEAMACGAPVLASANSSITEVVGDAGILVPDRNIDGLGDQISRVLEDTELRTRMSASSIARAKEYSWDLVAQKVVNAYNQLPLSSRHHQHPNTEASRPRLAVFSPVNPQSSGIADYTEELVEHLLNYFEIDLYLDSDVCPTNQIILDKCQWYCHSWYDENYKTKKYLTTLFHMGNHYAYHKYMIRYLKKYGGVTTLHDFGMGCFVTWLSQNLPRYSLDRLDLFEELKLEQGTMAGLGTFQMMESGGLRCDELFGKGIALNQRIFERSFGVILHSDWAYEIACQNLPDYPRSCLRKIPMGVTTRAMLSQEEIAGAREKLGFQESQLIVAAFGIVAPPKRIEPTIRAFAKLSAVITNSVLLFVGEVFQGYLQPDNLVRELHLDGQVKFTGRVALDNFCDYMMASDIVLNLRYPTQGETSAALVKAMSFGKPVIVSNGGAFAEFPDSVVRKVKYGPDDEDEISQQLLDLAQCPLVRKEIGENAWEHVTRHHSWSKVAAEYAQFLGQLGKDSNVRAKLAANHAARKFATIGISPSDRITISMISRVIANLLN